MKIGLGLGLLVGLGLGCAHGRPAPGDGPRFGVWVESVDGFPVRPAGQSGALSYLVQAGDQSVRIWPIQAASSPDESVASYVSPPAVLFETDAATLRAGILIERSWTEAVAHEVTEDELTAGAAMIYVPRQRGSTIIELRFRRLSTGVHVARK